jgi:Icc protein
MTVHLTTVSQNHAVFHDSSAVHKMEELEPGCRHEALGHQFETLPELGKQLSKFATVNDVHFGETECGVTADPEMGPILSVAEHETPYPEIMNSGAILEMSAIDPDVVLVKGDLTCDGTEEQYAQFLEYYEGAFGDRLYHINGNHECYGPPVINAQSQIRIDLPGITLATIDTVQPGQTGGTVYQDDLDWLRDLSNDATNPVLVFGHHQIWDPATSYRSKNYFGIQPDESEAFIDLVASLENVLGYFAGHTHRNRVRYFPQTGVVPWVEVACVKDFPGMWAEYQVFEHGILQINHRISSPAALDWSEKTKSMYKGTYFDYAFGELSDRSFAVAKF